MPRMLKMLLISPALSLLSACGGGGGGGGGGISYTPVAFTSFSAAPKPGAVTITGNTLEGSFASNGSFNVTSTSGPTSGSATVQATYDGAGNQTAVSITGSRSSVNFSQSDGSTAGNLSSIGYRGTLVAVSGNQQNIAYSADQNYLGYNYQTYGIWETGLGTGSGYFGATSVGAATAGGSVPSSGTATFTGGAGGAYVDSSGVPYVAAGDATVSANFGTRSVSISSTNTNKLNQNTAAFSTASNLNLSGTMSYSAGVNSMSGTVSTSDGMTGSINGRFYGPTATEVGGTFYTTGAGVKTFIGAFGAKR